MHDSDGSGRWFWSSDDVKLFPLRQDQKPENGIDPRIFPGCLERFWTVRTRHNQHTFILQEDVYHMDKTNTAPLAFILLVFMEYDCTFLWQSSGM